MLLWAASAYPVAPLAAQGSGPARIGTETEFQKEPNGTVLGRVMAGTTVSTLSTKGNWSEVRFDGWIAAKALRDDRRDGYDVAVALSAGSTLRGAAGNGTTVATVRAGALLKRLETKGEWVRVQRSAWILQSALKGADAKTPATPPAAVATPAAAPTPKADSGGKPAATTLSAAATLSATSGGAPVATLEAPMPVTVLERKGGWAKVQLEGWVREGSLGEGVAGTGPSAADIRANPDRYLGQTVEWTIQILSIQKADELRPELPPGQPYVLARGPIPETG